MPAPVVHVMLCRATDKIPKAMAEVGGRFNAKLYIVHSDKQVRKMLLEQRQPIDLVLVGGGLSAELRGAMVQAIASLRPDLTIHINGVGDGSLTFAQFMDQVLRGHVPRH